MILATDEVLTATLKVISATTTVILATEEVISVTLKVISATTKVIFTTNNLMSARKSDARGRLKKWSQPFLKLSQPLQKLS